LRIYQKTSNNSRNVFNYAGKILAGINAKLNTLSSDMHLITEHLVYEEIFSIYPMGFPFFNESSMGDPCKALYGSYCYRLLNVSLQIQLLRLAIGSPIIVFSRFCMEIEKAV
jgi:hypothetical protein